MEALACASLSPQRSSNFSQTLQNSSRLALAPWFAAQPKDMISMLGFFLGAMSVREIKTVDYKKPQCLKLSLTGADKSNPLQPYIDLRSGFLKAQVINMNLYSVNSTGQRVTQSLNCQVVGNELPGCYTTQVARAAGIAPTMVQSASIAGGALPPSPQNNVPAGSVLSVNVQTWVCRNGECLTLSPKFSTEDHNH